MSNIIREEALNWFKEANYDLARARRSLDEGDYALSVFMSQQAIEKALKAVIIAIKRMSLPKTHDLVRLYNEVSDVMPLPQEAVDRLPEVSQYYVSARYPNAGLEVPSERINRAQAIRALEVANMVIENARRLLGLTQ
ncbi:MAG: HEPN domain-containing protein [Vulcanisaeta sp.]|uniref:HEPN domain-containing protein n=1 Tax=Vulcanisaeta sp. TaxID=2020871 RepID=UPI003D10BF31